jgi:mannose-6-phosphate isomerase-like protein (cupin superfamily)
MLMEVAGEGSPVMSLGARDVILFVGVGAGTVTISGRAFAVKATDGVYIRPSEAIQLSADAGQTLKLFVLACPLGEIAWLDEMPTNFDAQYEERVVPVDPDQRTAMGPRYFQILVDKRIGSNVITQFIGHIPRSKAAPHRHLYEEAIIVLSGEGYMWTEDKKARVTAGDVIFLPRKQLHSLEATSADGIDVVGVICPGDNHALSDQPGIPRRAAWPCSSRGSRTRRQLGARDSVGGRGHRRQARRGIDPEHPDHHPGDLGRYARAPGRG